MNENGDKDSHQIVEQLRETYSRSDRHDIAQAAVLVDRTLAEGENVLIRDSNHTNPDHRRLISDPISLQMYGHHTRDVLLEIDPGNLESLHKLQKATHVSINRITQELVRTGNVVQAAMDAGRTADDTINTANLVMESQRQKIRLHGVDDDLGNNAHELRERYALSSLSPQDRKAWEDHHPENRVQRWDTIDSTVKWATQDPNGIRISQIMADRQDHYRIATGPTESAPNDIAVVDKAVKESGKGPILGQYGSGHDDSFRGMSANLTVANGRKTMTIERYDPDVNDIEKIVLSERHFIKPPDYIFRGDTGEVRKLRSDALTQACEVQADWIQDKCSYVVPIDVPHGSHTPDNAPRKPGAKNAHPAKG